MVSKYCIAIMHYKGKRIHNLFHVILEKLSRIVELPTTVLTEGAFLKLNEEEQYKILQALLVGTWKKQTKEKKTDEARASQINTSNVLYFFI